MSGCATFTCTLRFLEDRTDISSCILIPLPH
jgi:hypothetical protein